MVVLGVYVKLENGQLYVNHILFAGQSTHLSYSSPLFLLELGTMINPITKSKYRLCIYIIFYFIILYYITSYYIILYFILIYYIILYYITVYI